MNFHEGAKDIKQSLTVYRERLRTAFVAGAYQIHRGIITKFYSSPPGASIGVARRTGTAAKSWKVDIRRSPNSIDASVYSAGAPYANFGHEKVITPNTKKWLAIPVGPSLTASGAARYPDGPRQASCELTMPPVRHGYRKQRDGERDALSFFKKDGTTSFLFAKPGVKGIGLSKKNRLMFVLKKKVTIPAKNAGLMPWVDMKVDTLINRLSNATAGKFELGA